MGHIDTDLIHKSSISASGVTNIQQYEFVQIPNCSRCHSVSNYYTKHHQVNWRDHRNQCAEYWCKILHKEAMKFYSRQQHEQLEIGANKYMI